MKDALEVDIDWIVNVGTHSPRSCALEDRLQLAFGDFVRQLVDIRQREGRTYPH